MKPGAMRPDGNDVFDPDLSPETRLLAAIFGGPVPDPGADWAGRNPVYGDGSLAQEGDNPDV